MLVQRIEAFVQLRIVLDEAEIGCVDGLRDAGVHQRPEVERAYGRGVGQRCFDGLRRTHVAVSEPGRQEQDAAAAGIIDRKSTRLNSSHSQISYAVFCLKKKISS